MSVFRPDAPPKNLAWPATADMTAMELISYHPECLKNLDVIHRFIKNGGTPGVMAVMVNFARVLKKDISANTILVMMKATMERYGYEGWTVERHDLYFPQEIPRHLIAVDGYRNEPDTFGNMQSNKKGVITKFAFADFKKGINTEPEGYDVLDFKRCIDYAYRHSDVAYTYPEHYEHILNSLGGPAPVMTMHSDLVVFRRWGHVSAALNNPALPQVITAPSSQNDANRQMADAGSQQPISKQRASLTIEEDLDMNEGLEESNQLGENYDMERHRHHQPWNYQQSQGSVPSNSFTSDAFGNGGIDELFDDNSLEPYPQGYRLDPSSYPVDPGFNFGSPYAPVNQPLSYFQPSPTLDPYAVGAHSGPRTVPPYRNLHQIEGIVGHDFSGFAESVRWAIEHQNLPDMGTWTESPEDLEILEGIRMSQEWISFEQSSYIAEMEANRRMLDSFGA